MGKTAATQRFNDESDVLVTFDPRARILDVPDDGRVMELLSGPSPSSSRLFRPERFSPSDRWRRLELARDSKTGDIRVAARPVTGGHHS